MLMSAAAWKLRLENEYKAMCAFPIQNLFSWKLAPGQTPPLVRSYLITYYVTTKVQEEGKLVNQNRTQVLITMPDSAAGAPVARIVSGKIPFHPNIYVNGDFCLGSIWDKNPRIWTLVISIGKVLAFDPSQTDPGSAANPTAAADWYKKQSGLYKCYPCGRIDFPRPVGY